MPERPGRDDPVASVASHNLLQQKLITAHARLDRELSQLMRLHRLSNQLLERMDSRPVVEIFSEAIVDVLDVAIGAVWILSPADEIARRGFAAFGTEGIGQDWAAAGARLASALPQDGKAAWLDPALAALLPDVELRRPLACCCVGREGRPIAVVLASNTASVDGMFVALSDETAEMLAVLAKECAAHLDNRMDRIVIERQVASLRESREQLELVLRGTNDGWWDWDLVRDRCFLSARWMEMLGAPEAADCTREGFWDELLHPEDQSRFRRQLHRALGGTEKAVEAEIRLRREDGQFLPVLLRGTILRDAEGRPTRFAGTILDLTDRKRYEAHIHQLAFYDPLTELPNRRLLNERLRESVRARERNGQTFALILLDIDRFKWLNDTYGHAAGDQLLRLLAARLRAMVRSCDTVARLGGDEFVVLLEGLGTDGVHAQQSALAVASKVLNTLNEPYVLDVGAVNHSVSIGMVVGAGEEPALQDMLRAADVALYQAKQDGRNMLRLFDPAMQAKVDMRSTLEARLRRAFSENRLQMHYQPQVDAAGRLIGAEALMRWRKRDGVYVAPADFIQVAEESGFIHRLGAWALQTACEQVVRWRDRLPAGFRVAVNLSAAEFTRPDFASRVLETLERTGAMGTELCLEITERTVVHDLNATAERMRALMADGIEFALDDFGTGNSSLTFLQKLPVQEVKIDASYVQRMLEHRGEAAIVRAILAMCDALGLRAVAEGVETREQMERLAEEGCYYFQGYLVGRPMPATDDPADLIGTPHRV